MTDDAGRAALEAALSGRGAFELFACDPALADTAAFCAAYGFAMGDSANTIVVAGKADPPRYAACVVLATHRLDVNRVVRVRLGTRKASFAGAAETVALTGQEIGGVTAFGLPDHVPLWVDFGGDDAPAHRAGWGQSQLEGARPSGDPAHRARHGGRRGPGRARGTGAGTVPGSLRPAGAALALPCPRRCLAPSSRHRRLT